MVRCADCGYLALRNVDTRALDEAEQQFRSTAEVSPKPQAKFNTHEGVPVCFAMAYNLRDEAGAGTREEVLKLVDRERDCSRFTKWRQGYTPKEHQEMLDREEFRKWQEEQRQQERRWQEEVRNSDRRWRIIEVVLTVLLAGLFTILGALISRGH